MCQWIIYILQCNAIKTSGRFHTGPSKESSEICVSTFHKTPFFRSLAELYRNRTNKHPDTFISTLRICHLLWVDFPWKKAQISCSRMYVSAEYPNGVFTLPNTVTDTNTDTDKMGLQPIASASVSASVSVLVSGSVNSSAYYN